jgi:hypothetical protein
MFTVDEDYEGEIKDVLRTAVGNAAKKLALAAGGEINKVALAGKTGDLYITSEPTEATVEIDGKTIVGQTPLTLQGIAAGEHRVIVRKGDYYGAKSINLAPNDLLKLKVAMEQGKGSLKIFTTPDGASVFIDNRREGVSPCKIDNVSVGEHTIAIEKVGYLPYYAMATVTVNETINNSISLKPAAYITITIPGHPDARIIINGTKVESGLARDFPVEAKDFEITVEKTGYKVFSKRLNLMPGEHELVNVELVSIFGTVEFISKPESAKIYLNGQAVGITPYRNTRLTPGTYQLQIITDDYDTISENFAIEAGESKLFVDTLIPKYGELSSLTTPSGASVSIGVKAVSMTPCIFPKLEPGVYKVRIQKPGYIPIMDSVMIIKNQRIQKCWELQHTKAYIDSVAEYEHKLKDKVQWGRRILFSSLAIGTAGAGGFFNYQAKRAYEKYSALEYSKRSDVDLYWKKVEDSRKKRNVFYVFSGVLASLFVISIPF